MKRRALIIAWLAATFIGGRASLGQSPGPGVSNLTYPPEELFQIIGSINGPDVPAQHGTAVMHNGYLVIPFAGGVSNGGFGFYDISNPYDPVFVNNVFFLETREGHSLGFSNSYPGMYAVTQGSFGIHFWDWTDVMNPVLLHNMTLPGIQASDYDNGAWWVFWQAPYVYVSGSSQGLYIVDATDPTNPTLLNRVPNSQTGGFRMGSLFAIGNLLVTSKNDGSGLATLDISDPANPVLLATNSSRSQYSTMVGGDKILLAATGSNNGLATYDISDPTQISFVQSLSLGDRGGYLTMQDGFAHLGASAVGYFKIDIQNDGSYNVIGSADFPQASADLDFVSVIGNLTVLSDDHNNGTLLTPHQSEPDTIPPSVNMVNPKLEAVNQALTTRVGLTFTDRIDLRSVDQATFIVRPIGGQALSGKYSGQTGIVNFSPDQPLLPNTTYEIRVPVGGIKDYVGNSTADDFVSFFSTGADVVTLDCDLQQNGPGLVGHPVFFEADCVGPDVDSYSWNFGDGESSPFSVNPSATHTYDAPGHYIVTLTAFSGATEFKFNMSQTVVYPAGFPAPVHTSSIVLDQAQGRVWNVNPDNNTVTVTDAQSLTKLFERPVGKFPRTLAIAPNGDVWVTNQDDATISVLDGTNGQLLETIDLPYASRPYGIVFEPLGSVAYVTLEATGKLLMLDIVSGSVLDDVDVGSWPRGIAVLSTVSPPKTRILVANFISPVVFGLIREVDGDSFNVTNIFKLAFDPGPDTESSGRGVPNYVFSPTVSPDGRRAWVPSKKDNVVRGLFRSGEPLTFENTVRTIVSQLDLSVNAEDRFARLDLNDRALASAVIFNPLGDYVFVATLGSNTVEVLDAFTGETATSIENVGLAPQGMVLGPSGDRLFIHNYMSRTVTVYDVGNIGDDVSQVSQLAVIPVVENELLPPLVLRGKQIFYNAADDRMSRDNYISCASCHLEGGSDQRVWDFTDRGEGLRNTTSLINRAGLRHGPVHWSANFDEIQDFEHDIRGAFEGRGFMEDADFHSGTRDTPLGDPKKGVSFELDAMAAYLASLRKGPPSPFRNSDGTMTASAAAGRFIFHSVAVQCGNCHRGSELTDSDLYESPFLLHDVGTLKPGSGRRLGRPLTGLDTPSLKGVWRTAPYLHDGSAATLMDVLTTANPNDVHGRTSNLTQSQLLSLLAYVQQLDNTAPADLDGDLDVDGLDLDLIQDCFTGMDQGPPDVGCGRADLDDDGDVDDDDIDLFLSCQSGSGFPADPACGVPGNDSAPFKATYPSPADQATEVVVTPVLNWTAGVGAVSQDVYFGPGDPPAFQGNQLGTAFATAELEPNTTYYWRVDTINAVGVTTGQVWSFTTAAPEITITNLNRYQVATLSTGDTYFLDRDFTITQMPPFLEGSLGIKTENDDKAVANPVWVTFEVDIPVEVYVAYDTRATSLPAWMNGFIETGDIIGVSDQAQISAVLYKKTYPPGGVMLGGNLTPPAAGAFSNYFVLVVPHPSCSVDCLPGDLNCDGKFDGHDVYPFVLALTDPVAYDVEFGDCDANSGDLFGDGQVNNFDVAPFVQLLLGR
ncbi:MAG: Ig-like domain-containing protein [Phycisphaerales bacterium]|nr:Ig-like domain-containing protein [Phycisphaerales bacterium]